MFEKYTERARRVMTLARQHSQKAMSEFIGSEHILLGLVDETGGVAAKVLAALKVGRPEVVAEIAKHVTPPANPPTVLGQIPFSPRVKRVFELAVESAASYGHDVVGTEHVLIGLVRETEGIAFKVLSSLLPGLDIVKRVEDAIGVHDKKPVDATVLSRRLEEARMGWLYVLTLAKDIPDVARATLNKALGIIQEGK